MKKFFVFIGILVLFSSCKIIEKDYWIAMQITKDDKLLNVNWDANKELNYINIKTLISLNVVTFLFQIVIKKLIFLLFSMIQIILHLSLITILS